MQDTLSEFLQENGYTQSKYGDAPYHWKAVDTKYDCVSNEKAPIFLVNKFVWEDYASYTLALRGGVRSYKTNADYPYVAWADFNFYSLSAEVLIGHLVDFESTLIQAWEAAHNNKKEKNG
jgi:hypothetical protein